MPQTAMQELINELKIKQKAFDPQYWIGIQYSIERLNSYLGKEKQQIINSHTNGQKSILEIIFDSFGHEKFSKTRNELNSALSGNDNDITAENYYNEQYV